MSKIQKTALIFLITIIFVISSTFAASASVASPYVSGSSIDYGFVNYSIPYLETLNGQIYGYARDFSPFFYQYGGPLDDITSTTNNYYSYCASAILYPDNDQKLIKNSSYLSVMSINFSKPVYKATFRIFLGDGARFDNFTFSSFGGDNLAQWDETIQSNYAVVSIYNIEHPVKMYFRFKVGSADLSGIGFNISLATLIYQDGTAEQIQNDNANTDKIIGSQNSNADKITGNQDANTDKIIDNQNQIVENEKNEANTSGNSATESVGAAVPDKSAGFITALKTFTKAMSTTNTDCTIKMPSIKIPEIEGFFPETVLTSETDVNFNQVINLIPSSILGLIQALTTVGLIVFCFKEVYDTISEALTRRKSDE